MSYHPIEIVFQPLHTFDWQQPLAIWVIELNQLGSQ